VREIGQFQSEQKIESKLEAAMLQKKRRNIEKIESLPKVKGFLNSIGRNSKNSKRTYSTGLALLQDYLDSETFQQRYHETINYKCDCETRSYFAFYDIDVIPSKFKQRVKMPKSFREDEEPIDAADIRKILLNCNNRKLKAYLLMLASGGMRAVEATAVRLKDIDFSVTPTKIHLRPEFSKTRTARDIYISDEATMFLNQFLEWKYRDKSEAKDEGVTKLQNPDDLVFSTFSINEKPNPHNLYNKLLEEFQKVLTVSDLDERKENGIHKRRKITLHSFRRFVKTVASQNAGRDWSEWFLGHIKSPYWVLKEPDRREIYATKVMRYLTFLDYSGLESSQKSIEEKLAAREQEIFSLKHDNNVTTTTVQTLSDQVLNLTKLVEDLQKKRSHR
jgi:integrase